MVGDDEAVEEVAPGGDADRGGADTAGADEEYPHGLPFTRTGSTRYQSVTPK
jgi:hypothetical protein